MELMLRKTNGNVNSNVQMTEKNKTVIVYAKKTLMNMYIPILTVLPWTWDMEQVMHHIVNVMLDSEEIIKVMEQ